MEERAAWSASYGTTAVSQPWSFLILTRHYDRYAREKEKRERGGEGGREIRGREAEREREVQIIINLLTR